MSSYAHAKEQLAKGEIVKDYKEGGNSMTPIISSNEPVDLAPIDWEKDPVQKGDVVLCSVRGNHYSLNKYC